MEVFITNRNHQVFVIKAYAVTISFLAISCIQIFLAVFLENYRKYLLDQRHIAYIALVFYFMTIMLLIHFQEVRLAPAYSLTLTLVMVEGLTAAVMTLSVFYNKNDIFKSYGTALAASVGVITFANACSCDYMLCVPFLIVLSVLNFAFCAIMIALVIMMADRIIIILFASVALGTSLIFLTYHTLLISSGKVEIQPGDPFTAGLITFIDVTVIYILILLLHKPANEGIF